MSNWMVLINTEEGTELRGIYPTKRAAQFISQRVKYNEKLEYFPKIAPTDAGLHPANNRVEEHLEWVEQKKRDEKSFKDEKTTENS